MSDDISKLLGGLMANPDGIKNLMSAFSQNAKPQQPAQSDGELMNSLNTLSSADDRRISLLTALKPYLNTSRSANVDRAIQLLKLTKLTEALRNEGK